LSLWKSLPLVLQMPQKSAVLKALARIGRRRRRARSAAAAGGAALGRAVGGGGGALALGAAGGGGGGRHGALAGGRGETLPAAKLCLTTGAKKIY
jgi:hypothetical protein